MEFLHYTPSGNIGKQKPVIENINTNKVHLKKTARAVRNVVKIIRDSVRHLFCCMKRAFLENFCDIIDYIFRAVHFYM